MFIASDTGAESCPQAVCLSQQGGRLGRWMIRGQGQAQPVVNREFWAAVEPIQVGVTRTEKDSTFLLTLGQRHPREPKPGTGESDSHGVWWE